MRAQAVAERSGAEVASHWLGSSNRRRKQSSFTSLPVREEMVAKYSNLSLESHNISLTDAPVEKNITLERPSDLELVCQFTTSVDLNSVNVTWQKDDEFLENFDVFNTTKVGNTLYSQYRFIIFNSKQMGNYSCFLNGKEELRGTFNIRVPNVHGKSKPLITYVGDSTVLKCECQDGLPLNWTWYRSNGSAQVPIDVHKDDKYIINGSYANETRLKVKHLLEEDGGSYWCRAIFQLGESEEHIELVVLSFMVPLKPFLAIIAEVILLVAIILLCEVYTQKKKNDPDDGKEFEQIEQLKSDDSNGIENNAPRLRKNFVLLCGYWCVVRYAYPTQSINSEPQLRYPQEHKNSGHSVLFVTRVLGKSKCLCFLQAFSEVIGSGWHHLKEQECRLWGKVKTYWKNDILI
ncbi:hypothetical protein STEG23_019261, partial [Scotinomys teguina]